MFAPRYGLDRPAELRRPVAPARRYRRWRSIAAAAAQPVAEVSRACSQRRARKLLAVRARACRPARDDKVLTSWNALMIRGLAIAARALERARAGRRRPRARSTSSARTLWRDGRLLATYMDGRGAPERLSGRLRVPRRCDPGAAAGALPRGRARASRSSCWKSCCEHFEDAPAGGFFFTSDDHEQLIHRSKTFGDDATPSGNGSRSLSCCSASATCWVSRVTSPPPSAPCARRGADCRATRRRMRRCSRRWRSCCIRRRSSSSAAKSRHRRVAARARRAAMRRGGWCSPYPRTPRSCRRRWPRRRRARRTVAYVCRGSVCSAPLESLQALLSDLRASASS